MRLTCAWGNLVAIINVIVLHLFTVTNDRVCRINDGLHFENQYCGPCGVVTICLVAGTSQKWKKKKRINSVSFKVKKKKIISCYFFFLLLWLFCYWFWCCFCYLFLILLLLLFLIWWLSIFFSAGVSEDAKHGSDIIQVTVSIQAPPTLERLLALCCFCKSLFQELITSFFTWPMARRFQKWSYF